jgi:hypothetical protein
MTKNKKYNYKMIVQELEEKIQVPDSDGLRIIAPLFEDYNNLKMHTGCRITTTNYNNKKAYVFASNCQSYPTASGGFMAKHRTKTMIGFVVSGREVFIQNRNNSIDGKGGYLVSFATESIWRRIQNLISAVVECAYYSGHKEARCQIKKIWPGSDCLKNCADLLEGSNIKDAIDLAPGNEGFCACIF